MLKRLCCAVLFTIGAVHAQQPAAPVRTFGNRCTICHGTDGNGSDRAPAVLGFVAAHSDAEIATLVRTGRLDKGMPRFDFSDDEMKGLIAHLRGLVSGDIAAAPRGARALRSADEFQPHPANLTLPDGRQLQGTLTSEAAFGATLLTSDGKFHSLIRDGNVYRERPLEPKQDWPSYDGSFSANRYSSLEQISVNNVQRLLPAWVFPVPAARQLEVTPVVLDGVMYLTGPNAAYALDAATGQQIWSFSTPRAPGLLSTAAGGANRGVAISGDRVFMITDNAHLLALDRRTGKKLWDATMGDTKDGYSATAAPLAIGDLVLSGVAGGEQGARGFVDAYSVASGERAWRFYTVPARGEKGSETWIGNALEHGCGATWLTGSYDPSLETVYWAVGNPCPDYNGDERKGDNLYTASVVALDGKTGKLKWYFQFTPHDLYDWDSVAPMLLVDETWQGQPRKLLLHGDPNGFFFVIDRTNGELLMAKPLSKVNWATGYGKDGRPVLTDRYDSAQEVCRRGASKWYSTAYDPVAKLFFARVKDTCAVYKKDPSPLEMGEMYFGGGQQGAREGQSFIQALDIQTGQKAWEYPVTLDHDSGTLATAGDLLFFGEGEGTLTAVETKTGKPVWHFETGQSWNASPMTYMVGGKQYVVLAGSGGICTFALAQ